MFMFFRHKSKSVHWYEKEWGHLLRKSDRIVARGSDSDDLILPHNGRFIIIQTPYGHLWQLRENGRQVYLGQTPKHLR